MVLTANVYDSLIAGSDLLDINVSQFGGTNGTFASGRPETNTSHIAGSAVSTSSAQIGVNVVNAGGTAWASGALTSGVFAAGAITAAAIAADAIGASELAADAVSEIAAAISIPSAATIADAVWDEDATAHQTQGTFGQAIGDPAADANTIYGAVVTGATGATIAADIITIDDFLDTEIAAIKTVTDAQGATGSGLTAIPWNASWDAEVQSEVQDALDATLADSVPADGTRPSIAQALYMLVQFMTERAVSGTTVTVKKVDGSTSLMTFTLNDATTPTSITRAT